MRRIPTAVVYVKGKYPKGPTCGEVALYHADSRRASPPARNPFFLDKPQQAKVRRRLAQGAREILKGLSSGLKQTMSDVGKEAAKDIAANLRKSKHVAIEDALRGGTRDPPSPTKMAPLSPAYAEYRRKRWGVRHKKPLQRTGRMLKGITHRVED